MFAVLLVLSLFSGTAGAQSLGPGESLIEINDTKSCGLVTRFSPNRIAQECFPDIRNIILDRDWSMLRRNGYAKYNATPCAGSQPVRGLWPFNATDGSQYIIMHSSASMFYSKGDGTCTPITGLNGGLSTTAQMSCVQTLGYLWCTDGTDPVFRTNVTSTNTIVAAPTGLYIGAFRNRVVISGVPANLTSVYLSGELDGTDWNLPTITYSTSPAIIKINGVNDGLAVSCLMGEYQNSYLIGRQYDLWGLAGNDLRDFSLRQVSSQVGCMENKSTQEVNNVFYWLSHRGIEGYTGTQIQRASYNIDPTLQVIIAAAGNSQAQTLTTQADWQSGNLTASGPGAPMSATISPGNVVPSSWSFSNNGLGTDWAMIDVDTTTGVSGTLDNFDDNTLTGGGVVWTQGYGNMYVTDHRMAGSLSATGNSASTPLSLTSGTWSFVMLSSAASAGTELGFYFMADSTDPFTCTSYKINIDDTGPFFSPKVKLQYYSNGATTLSGVDVLGLEDGLNHVFRISRASTGFMNVSVDGVVIISTGNTQITSGLYNIATIPGNSEASKQHLASFKFPGFYRQQRSVEYDTSFTTPTFSNYTVLMSSSSASPVSLNSQSATAAGGPYSAFSPIGNGVQYSTIKRYFKHQILPDAPTSVSVASVTRASLSAETTGYYITPCITATGNTGWGNINVNAVTNGGSFTFYMSTGTSCGQVIDPFNANWAAVTANSIISVPVSPFTAVRVLFSLDIATEVPTLNDITVNWNAGASRPPVASASYKNEYWLFYTTSQAVGASNDHVLILDENLKWVAFDDINAASAAIYLNTLYTGDSLASGTVFQQDTGNADNGGPYTMTFTTPDLDGGDPISPKNFKRAYLIIGAPSPTTLSGSFTCSYTISGSTTSYPLGTVDLTEAPEQGGYFVAKLPFPADSPTTGQWVGMSCYNTGTVGPLRIFGIRVAYTKTEWP